MRSAHDLEIRLLLEGILEQYGYDFRGYAEASLTRRLQAVMSKFQIEDSLMLLRKILKEPEFFTRVLSYLTVTTSEMFRDPEFFKALRTQVMPTLRTYPNVNFWIAGCSTGEEVYSLAIVLKEEGMFDRSTIFATDINPRALKAAKGGIFSIESMKLHTKNYQESGGRELFHSYYTADYGLAKMDSELTTNVVFSEHNLVHDSVFAECHMILCRNVLIYFNRDLQTRVLELFEKSLRYGTFLGLGSKETLRFSPLAPCFDSLNEKWRIYRRNRAEHQTPSRSQREGGAI